MPATAVREKPILFSGAMVRAILDGRKTVTRRVVGLDTLRRSETPSYDWTWRGQAPVRSIAQQQRGPRGCWQDLRHADFMRLCPYGQPGDRLWVREAWRRPHCNRDTPLLQGQSVAYRATHDFHDGFGDPWRPSIHMPRWASRLTLEITDVRVERLQDITEADAKSEGASFHDGRGVGHSGWRHDFGAVYDDARSSFAGLWDSINAKSHPWNTNPWVWVVSFKRV